MKIALSGKMMSGKTIVANYLVSKYGFIELAFADKLKQIAHDLFGMSIEDKDRELLQLLGMKMRELDVQVWIKYLIPYITHYTATKDVMISDVRLLNEYAALKGLGFTMVRCYVEKQLQLRRIKKEMPDMPLMLRSHRSETNLDIYNTSAWDYIINNNGCTMKELLEQVDDMVDELRGWKRV